MNDNLLRACATALYYAKHYDDSNPDVGFGTLLETLAQKVLKIAELPTDPHTVGLVVDAYKQRWER